MNETDIKLVIVTGATRGLGLAIASKCAEAGFRVVGASRKSSEAFSELQALYPDRVAFHALDLGRTDRHHEWAKTIEVKFGPVYGLVNNAAISHDGVLATMHSSEIEELVSVNITGTIVLTKYLLRSMLVQQTGRIINIASIIASTGFSGLSVYAATKGALLGFTKSLAREVGRAHVTVNTISPGYLATDMSAGLTADKVQTIIRRSPLGELADVGDVSAAVVYLLLPQASRITGIDFVIDAGSSI